MLGGVGNKGFAGNHAVKCWRTVWLNFEAIRIYFVVARNVPIHKMQRVFDDNRQRLSAWYTRATTNNDGGLTISVYGKEIPHLAGGWLEHEKDEIARWPRTGCYIACRLLQYGIGWGILPRTDRGEPEAVCTQYRDAGIIPRANSLRKVDRF